MLPYSYALAADVTRRHRTILRPLVMDFGADPRTLDIADQYLYGPALLVSPVTRPWGTAWPMAVARAPQPTNPGPRPISLVSACCVSFGAPCCSGRSIICLPNKPKERLELHGAGLKHPPRWLGAVVLRPETGFLTSLPALAFPEIAPNLRALF